MSTIIKKLLVSIILFYQRVISPSLPANCRFYPTCSEYSIQAIDKFGVVKGLILMIKRLCKCHPLGSYGYDPVPDNFNLNPFRRI